MSSQILSGSKFWQDRNLPSVLQSEAAECGLACICMIASFWGHQINLSEMRQAFSVSIKGTTLLGLSLIAKQYSFNFRAVKVEPETLHELKLPCILHWRLNHFVVLKSISRKSFVIHDPASGIRKISFDEMNSSFTGVAAELTPGDGFEKKKNDRKYSLFSLMGRIVGVRSSIVQIFGLGISLQFCSLMAPFYLQWVVDDALISADRNLITVLAVGFFILVCIQAAISSMRSWITTVLSTNFNFQWLGNAFSHLLKLPLSYFEKRSTGDIVSRFGSINVVQQSITTQFIEAFIDGSLVIVTLLMMTLYSPILSFFALTTVFLYVGSRIFFFHALKASTMDQIAYAAKQQTSFIESIRGAQSIRLYNGESVRHARWINMLADQFNASLRVSKLTICHQNINTLLFGVERVIVIWYAAVNVLDAKFSVGMLLAFLSYKEQFSQRISGLVDKIFEFRMLSLHGERIADIVTAKAEVEGYGVEVEPIDKNPKIEIRSLSFRYSVTEPDILSGINLVILPGQSVALTGSSGSGKTTLVKILLGLLEPTSGEILIDGKTVSDFGRHRFRRLLGTVMQNDNLFSGSLIDNISFFDPQPDFEKIRACAIAAAIHDDIMRMPMTYHSMIGDIGSGLSGGQTQRLLLARALYRSPKVLVLDEATSSLDINNEKNVNESIKSLNMTRIFVAHRPQTIEMAERIVLLEKGKIVSDVLNV